MPRRQWFQFSLRTFFIVVAILACWLGWKVDRARKQQAAVKAIEAIGGVVQYDWQGDIRSWEVDSRSRFVPWHAEPLAPVCMRNLVGEHFCQTAMGVAFRTRQTKYYQADFVRGTDSSGPNWIRTTEIEALIPRLHDLPHLQVIYLEGDITTISKAVEKKLKASFPRCQVIREYVHTAVKTLPPPPRPRQGRGFTPLVQPFATMPLSAQRP